MSELNSALDRFFAKCYTRDENSGGRNDIMKAGRILSLVCAAAVLVCMLACLAGCTSSQVSYDTVVCSYSWSLAYGAISDMFTRTYTVYADNRIVVSAHFSENMFGEEHEYYDEAVYEITEAEKQAVIKAVRSSPAAVMSDISTDSLDGSYNGITLYNAAGEPVHYCGGLNPDAKWMDKITSAIMAPLEDEEITLFDSFERMVEEKWEQGSR